MLRFRPVITFLFLAKVPHFFFLNIERGSVKVPYLCSLPFETDFIKIQVCGSSSTPFSGKNTIFGFFE